MNDIKTIITCFLGLGTLGLIPSCTTVEQQPASHTTTTETTLSRPTNIVETKTTRSY